MSIKFKDSEKNVYIKGLGICKAMLHILQSLKQFQGKLCLVSEHRLRRLDSVGPDWAVCSGLAVTWEMTQVKTPRVQKLPALGQRRPANLGALERKLPEEVLYSGVHLQSRIEPQAYGFRSAQTPFSSGR